MMRQHTYDHLILSKKKYGCKCESFVSCLYISFVKSCTFKKCHIIHLSPGMLSFDSCTYFVYEFQPQIIQSCIREDLVFTITVLFSQIKISNLICLSGNIEVTISISVKYLCANTMHRRTLGYKNINDLFLLYFYDLRSKIKRGI